jgi:Methyltransferase domain
VRGANLDVRPRIVGFLCAAGSVVSPGDIVAVTSADEGFIAGPIAAIPGWLFDPAGVLTLALLRDAGSSGEVGAAVEIGVFQGRYLALLRYGMPKGPLLGIDTFQWIDRTSVAATLDSTLPGHEPVDLWAVDSGRISADDLHKRVGGRPIRFISVDGDHAAGAVLHDLEMADAALAEQGVIAADDFLNPLAIGVTEGICSFFRAGPKNVVPFAFGGNKLFICRPSQQERYIKLVEALIHRAPHLTSLDSTRRFWSQGDAYFRQTLFGEPCLVLVRGLDVS